MRLNVPGFAANPCQKAGAMKFGRIIEVRPWGSNWGKHKTTYASDMQ